MQPHQPDPVERSNATDLARPDAEAPPAAQGRSMAPPSVLALAAGVVAGLIAWAVGEACLDLIKPPRHPLNSHGIILRVVYPRDQDTANDRNAALTFAILGAALGTALGVAGGLARRSRRAMLVAALIGSIAGAVACAGISLVLLPAYDAYRHRNPDDASKDLLLPFLLHAAIWSAAGAAGGLAFGFGLGRRALLLRAILGGIIGAIIGTAVAELVLAFALPSAETVRAVAETWPSRLLGRLAVGALAGAGIAVAAAQQREAPANPAS